MAGVRDAPLNDDVVAANFTSRVLPSFDTVTVPPAPLAEATEYDAVYSLPFLSTLTVTTDFNNAAAASVELNDRSGLPVRLSNFASDGVP